MLPEFMNLFSVSNRLGCQKPYSRGNELAKQNRVRVKRESKALLTTHVGIAELVVPVL